MIENFDATAELGGTLARELFHLRNLGRDPGQDSDRRLTLGPWLRPRFFSVRPIVEPENNERPGTVFPSRLRPHRFTAIDHWRESFERSAVSQRKILEDFAGRPFAGTLPTPLPGRRTRGFDLLPQSSEMRVQAGYSPFAIFQLECCRTNNLKKLNQEGCHENG